MAAANFSVFLGKRLGGAATKSAGKGQILIRCGGVGVDRRHIPSSTNCATPQNTFIPLHPTLTEKSPFHDSESRY